jgi:hypothetical protein
LFLFVLSPELFPQIPPLSRHTPRKRGISSTPRLLGSIAGALEYWITRFGGR